MSITVTCVDDPPVARDDSFTLAEDAGLKELPVLANDDSVDGGEKSIVSITQPANGAAAIIRLGSGLGYQADPNYCNTASSGPGSGPDDTFTHTLNGGSTATVAVIVTCVDDAPIAVDDSATVAEDSAAAPIDVLANDTDPDGDPKTIQSLTDPANDTATITGSGVDYEPDPDYCNDPPSTSPDTFTYTLNAGSTATVAVTVSCVDEPELLSAGGFHTCGVMTDGTVDCWGDDGQGQATPPAGVKFTSVSAGTFTPAG